MRILISTTRGAGHFGPLIPFAQALLRNNHDVLVTAAASVAPMVKRLGLDHWAFTDPPDHLRDPIFAQLGGLSDEEAGARVVGDVFVRIDARTALPGVRAAIQSWRPDVVLYESTEYAAALAADQLDVPAVRVGIFLTGEELIMDLAADPLEELRAELGLPADPGAERFRSAPTFTLVPSGLEHPGAPGPAHVQRFREPAAGTRLLPSWWSNRDAPLVYLTFGSVAPEMDFFPALYRDAMAALSCLPVRVLVTIGHERDPKDLGPLPENVHALRWVPQADVMAHASAVVCHGGSGTVLGALAAGVPLAILPLFADQPYNAQRVEEIGAGIALADAGEITGAVKRLLEDPSHRAAAVAIADEVGQLPLVDAACGILEELVAYSQPRSVA